MLDATVELELRDMDIAVVEATADEDGEDVLVTVERDFTTEAEEGETMLEVTEEDETTDTNTVADKGDALAYLEVEQVLTLQTEAEGAKGFVMDDELF